MYFLREAQVRCFGSILHGPLGKQHFSFDRFTVPQHTGFVGIPTRTNILQRFKGKDLSSSRTTRELFARFFTEGSPAQTLCVSDFDGTFYAGLAPYYLRGISNVELALFLWIMHIKSPTAFLPLSRELFALKKQSRRIYTDIDQNSENLSAVEQPLIEAFSEKVLRRCDQQLAEKAADLTSRFCHRDAIRTMNILQPYVGGVTFISKAFPMVLQNVRTLLKRKGIRVPVHCKGIVLKDSPWWQIDVKNSVLNRHDKKQALAEFAAEHPNYKRVIIFGDTEDDISLNEKSIELWGEQNVLFVCLYPKDSRVREASSVTLKNWRSVQQLITEATTA